MRNYVDDMIARLLDDPANWLSFDEETRELLKRAKAPPERVVKSYDALVEGCPSMMG